MTNKTIKDGSKLLDKQNRLSLLAMIIYSFKNEVDLDDWLLKYAEHNTTYNADQYENYLYMKKISNNINCITRRTKNDIHEIEKY